MDSASDRLLLEIEAKLEEDIVKIDKELIKTKEMCVSALDKINGLITHVDDSTATRLDSIHIAECAVKRRLYVKLALLGQKLNTVAASKKILEEVMVLGVPNYVDSSSAAAPSHGCSEPMDTEPSRPRGESSSRPDTSYSSPPPTPAEDERVDRHHSDRAHHHHSERSGAERHQEHRSGQPIGPGDHVYYTEHPGARPVRAAVMSTFNDSCVIQIIKNRVVKQVPYSSLAYCEA